MRRSYYPCAIFCREKFRNGEFGQVIYAEGEYMHDYEHGMINVSKWRYGADWEQKFGMPPMFYPTHSTSMIVSVTGAYATHVCGMGVPDRREHRWPAKSEAEAAYRRQDYYAREDAFWKNPFSNETMLCKMSDGSVARINEFRRVGHPGEVRMSMFGADASYEEQYNSRIWVDKTRNSYTDLAELLDAREDAGIRKSNNASDNVGGEWDVGSLAKIQRELMPLPEAYKALHNGHRGSHQFLVHEFITACVAGRQPANNVWQAARYLIPGLIAHESALRGGVLMEVPDLGEGGGQP